MADQISGIAGGATGGLGLGGTGLGGITGALQGGIGSLINSGQGYLDRWFPPDKRESLKAQLTKFATERPKLAAFILSQIALSGLPLALFVVMTITVVLFSLIAGLLVGLIGALLFIVFALGVALCVLLPTLFFTTFAAVFIFLWGLGAYYIVKWFNEKTIPGIHTGLTEGVKEKMGLQDVPALKGEAPPPPPSEKAPVPASGNPRPPKIEKHHKADDGDEEKENKPPKIHKETPNSAKKQHTSTGKGAGADVTNGVTNILGGAGGEIKKKTTGLGV
jgi:Promethin